MWDVGYEQVDVIRLRQDALTPTALTLTTQNLRRESGPGVGNIRVALGSEARHLNYPAVRRCSIAGKLVGACRGDPTLEGHPRLNGSDLALG